MTTRASSNWLLLQKSLVRHDHPRKQRKVDSTFSPNTTPMVAHGTPYLPPEGPNKADTKEDIDLATTEVKNGESIAALRAMVLGKAEYKTSQTAPGRYLALDCEMVGVGIEGNESSLARVSIVNYTGAIILDVFVKQREKVVDYRTQWSGVRSTDLADSARPFKEVQQTVADLIKDRILVGHAVYNDLKALLLSHPSPQIRDTQSLAYKHRVVKSRRPALRVLVKQELGIAIQSGEHNSVTDARATMALFRLYKKQWESGFRSKHVRAASKADPPQSPSSPAPSSTRERKRKRPNPEPDGDILGADESSGLRSRAGTQSSSLSDPPRARSPVQRISTPPHERKQRSKRQGPADSMRRKGISSGLTTVTKRAGSIKEVQKKGTRMRDGNEEVSGNNSTSSMKVKVEWWKSLGGSRT